MEGGLLYLVLALIGLAVAVGWIFVPFILLNHGAHLRRLIEEQQRTNQLLENSQVSAQGLDPRRAHRPAP